MDAVIGATLGSISRVIPSHSLGRGIGEFRWVELLDLLKHVKKIRFPNRLILISTASRGRGVTSPLL